MLHILVADGNVRESRDRHVAATGQTSAEAYAALIRALAPDAETAILTPADADGTLPPGTALTDFDGMILTGSTLHVGEGGAPVQRQLALMRASLAAGLPVFGSCWGVQVACVLAGGEAARNPRGPEYGFARRIIPNGRGRAHPLLAGRPATFDAPAVHLDAVVTPPPECTVLAGNDLLDVQAIEITAGGGIFWGTQYHPELDLDELAAMLRLSRDDVIEAGLCRDGAELDAYADDLEALAEADRPDLAWRHGIGPEVLDASRRRREIENFLERLVRPRAARR